MTDRTADIWGERTIHGKGTAWPARVDLHLDGGLSADDVDTWVQSACVLFINGCGRLQTRMRVAPPQALVVAS